MAISTFTPTRMLLTPMRFAMATAQRQLTEAQQEVTTGRHANMALTLGAATGSDISLRLQLTTAEQSLLSANQAKEKAGSLQASLSYLGTLTGSFRATLMGARSASSEKGIAVTAAQSALSSMRETLNSTYDGQYSFGGINSGTAPIIGYEDGPRDAIISAFTEEFGFPPDDPAAASLSAAQISSFLNGSFQALFEDASWQADWSNATNETALVRLGFGGDIDVATSANAAFARKMAASFSMIDVLGRSPLGRPALEAVFDASLLIVSEAEAAIGDEQARIGAGESRLAEATVGLEAQQRHFTLSIQTLEGVDSYEAAARVNTLMTELEASYALTARISKMSLLSYI